eukprot:3212354-Lingulodinium_polyedra.AAC.1
MATRAMAGKMTIFFVSTKTPKLDFHPMPGCNILVITKHRTQLKPSSHTDPKLRGKRGVGVG